MTVVDALGGDYYAQQHLPGAIPLVEADLAAHAARLLPDKHAAIVTYCSNPQCANSERVATLLSNDGYTAVRQYREGIQRLGRDRPAREGRRAGVVDHVFPASRRFRRAERAPAGKT